MMRSRKVVEEDFESATYSEDRQRKILLEVMLDVRELLLEQPKVVEVTDGRGRVVKVQRTKDGS